MTLIAAIETTRVDGRSLPSALAADWNRLAGDVPCRQWEWLEPWWRHYATASDELFVLTVRDAQGELIGIAPFYLSRSLSHGRVMRFLGSGDVCSDYLTILAAPDAQSIVIEEIAEYLVGEAADRWDLIELAGVDACDEAVEMLVNLLSERDYLVHQQPGESCWRLELPRDWDSYLKTLSKGRRERSRQISRRLYDTGRAVSRQIVEPQELPRYFDVLIELHQKRRRSLGEPGCFSDPRFTAYHREVIERFFALGRLRLQCVLLDDRPVAIEYSLTGGGAIYFYQSGIETEILDQRPGWISTIGSLRAAIEQGYAAFDFMRGDEAYKSSWGARARPTLETRIIARRPSAQLRHTAWLAQRQMRRWAKAHWRRWRGQTSGSEA
jgi:CelD/BcsL family acetyltransferase involved in cellulose biosynthesis